MNWILLFHKVNCDFFVVLWLSLTENKIICIPKELQIHMFRILLKIT